MATGVALVDARAGERRARGACDARSSRGGGARHAAHRALTATSHHLSLTAPPSSTSRVRYHLAHLSRSYRARDLFACGRSGRGGGDSRSVVARALRVLRFSHESRSPCKTLHFFLISSLLILSNFELVERSSTL